MIESYLSRGLQEGEDLISRLAPDFLVKISFPTWLDIFGILGGLYGGLHKRPPVAWGWWCAALFPELWTTVEGVAVGPLSIEEAASYFALQALQDGLFVGGAYFVGRLLRETYHTRQARK